MFKNLAADQLGIQCSQNELIELAMTYKFGGMSLDLAEFQKQVEDRGLDRAGRFLNSAPIKVAICEVPLAFDLSEAQHVLLLKNQLPQWIKSAEHLGCKKLVAMLIPGSHDRPYHENFELHSRRISEISGILAEHDLQLGVGFHATAEHRAGLAYPFVSSAEALVAIARTTHADNFGLVVDAWEWTLSGGNVGLLDSLSADKVIEVRIADLPAGFDRDLVTSTERYLAGETGEVPVPAFLRKLLAMGYEGPVTPNPHASRMVPSKREEIVRRCAESTQALLAAARNPEAADEATSASPAI